MERIRKLYAWLQHTRRKLATVAVCLLAFWVLFRVMFGANGMLVYQQKKSEYRNLQQQIQELQKDNQALEQRTKALKNDPAAIEKEARTQLRYVRPGERIYLMPDKTAPETPPANAAAKKSGN